MQYLLVPKPDNRQKLVMVPGALEKVLSFLLSYTQKQGLFVF
jgi:hypothetical protein